LVGEKLWFKPRGWGGWGWSPASAEGWATILIVLVTVLLVPNPVLILLAVTALIAAAVLKGTSPGGPSARREFERRQL
jgi:hypothetical protein